MALRYRKKPVVVEGELRLSADNIEEVAEWTMKGIVASGARDTDVWAILAGPDAHLDINTLEGVMRADVGDYVIRGVQGEHYPCKADIFAATYEQVQ